LWYDEGGKVGTLARMPRCAGCFNVRHKAGTSFINSSQDGGMDCEGEKVWSATDNNKSLIKFLRLNVIEDYNMHMNSTDIADQL
jgi:hypothetical protein